MKIALYMEDGLEQIVLTAEDDFEKSMLAKLSNGSRTLSIKEGGFYACQGGWTRHQSYLTSGDREVESTIIVLRKPAAEPGPDLPIHPITQDVESRV